MNGIEKINTKLNSSDKPKNVENTETQQGGFTTDSEIFNFVSGVGINFLSDIRIV